MVYKLFTVYGLSSVVGRLMPQGAVILVTLCPPAYSDLTHISDPLAK